MNNDLAIVTKKAIELAEDMKLMAEKLTSITINHNVSDSNALIHSITIFALACFIGYFVIWKVTPALHTPLMSITNAISGIIILGSIISVSAQGFEFPQLLGLIGIIIASINIFGGFVVTKRMLSMFRKK